MEGLRNLLVVKAIGYLKGHDVTTWHTEANRIAYKASNVPTNKCGPVRNVFGWNTISQSEVEETIELHKESLLK